MSSPPPQRVVSLNQASTEILLSLGLADRMVGTATWTDPVRENLADANAAVPPRLADNKPSLETVLEANPDFVTASFGSSIGDGGAEGRDQYEKLGVPTISRPPTTVATATCPRLPTPTAHARPPHTRWTASTRRFASSQRFSVSTSAARISSTNSRAAYARPRNR